MHGILLSCLAGAPSSYLEVLHKLQKQVFRTVSPLLGVSLEPLGHRQIVAIAYVFSTGITLVDVHLKWLNWFHFLILEGGVPVMHDGLIDGLHDFSCHHSVTNLFVLLFLVTPCLVVAVQLCME